MCVAFRPGALRSADGVAPDSRPTVAPEHRRSTLCSLAERYQMPRLLLRTSTLNRLNAPGATSVPTVSKTVYGSFKRSQPVLCCHPKLGAMSTCKSNGSLALARARPILTRARYRTHRIDLTMCNPPFYESHDEIRDLAALKAVEPFATCTGSQVEMITPGGEVAFVGRLVDESVSASSRIRCVWLCHTNLRRAASRSVDDNLSSSQVVFELARQALERGLYSRQAQSSTCMLYAGTVAQLSIPDVREVQVSNYALYELTRGQTKRWIIAWSFQSARLPSVRLKTVWTGPSVPAPHLMQVLLRPNTTCPHRP